MSRSSNWVSRLRLCNSDTLCVLHGPIRLFVAINHQENEVPNLNWVVFRPCQGKEPAWKQCNNSTIPTFEPSYRSTIDELRASKIWSWKVRCVSTTLPLVMCRGDVSKYPDLVAQNGFRTEIPRFHPSVSRAHLHVGSWNLVCAPLL